jgi:hypothetical protein
MYKRASLLLELERGNLATFLHVATAQRTHLEAGGEDDLNLQGDPRGLVVVGRESKL